MTIKNQSQSLVFAVPCFCLASDRRVLFDRRTSMRLFRLPVAAAKLLLAWSWSICWLLSWPIRELIFLITWTVWLFAWITVVSGELVHHHHLLQHVSVCLGHTGLVIFTAGRVAICIVLYVLLRSAQSVHRFISDTCASMGCFQQVRCDVCSSPANRSR